MIYPKDIREAMADTDLRWVQVYSNLDISRSWFARMLNNEYLDPDQLRMERIMKFVKGYKEICK